MNRLGLSSAFFLLSLCLVGCTSETKMKTKDIGEMVLIPAGEFTMGGEKAYL